MHTSAAVLTDHRTALAAVADTRAAASRRDKARVVERLDALEPLLGPGWNPMKHGLRAAQSAADISRWDLVLGHLDAIEHRLGA